MSILYFMSYFFIYLLLFYGIFIWIYHYINEYLIKDNKLFIFISTTILYFISFIYFLTFCFILTYEINNDCININITEKSEGFLIGQVENGEKHYVTTYLSGQTLYIYDRAYHGNIDINKEEYKKLYPKMDDEKNIIFALYTFTIKKYLSFNSITN